MANANEIREAEDLLRYAWLHCRTERALFHREQLIHLFELAREPPTELQANPWRTWWGAHREVIDPLIEKARARLKPTPRTQWDFLQAED
jgi:hypothetical protein